MAYSMGMSSAALSIPSPKTSEQALQALQALRALPRRQGPRQSRVTPSSGKTVDVVVPREAFESLLEVLGQ